MSINQSDKKDYQGPLYARHPDLVEKEKRQSSTTSVAVTSSLTSSSANSSVSKN